MTLPITVDVAAYQPSPAGEFYIPALFPGRTLTGEEKLAQRFLLELTTDAGSMQYLPNRGGSLISLLQNGGGNEFDVFYAFNVALITTASNLQAEEINSDPPNERYGGATLTNIAISPGSYSLSISLLSLAGTQIGLIWPVDLVPTIQDLGNLSNLLST